MDIAAILVGGMGTRLKSLVHEVPKPLAPINGKPFLTLLLETLKKNDFHQVILLTGYKHELIEKAYGDGSDFGLKITYSQESSPLGTAGALKLAENYLSSEKNFLLLNGDSYCPEAIAALKNTSLNPNENIIAVSKVDDASRFGTISFDPTTKKIISFSEKVKNHCGFVNAGVYRLNHEIFEYIPSEQALSLEQDIFPDLLNRNIAFYAELIDYTFSDIGTPESYLEFVDQQRNAKDL